MTQLSMTRGDTLIFDVAVVDINGAPVSLTGKMLIFTVKARLSDADNAAIAQKKSPASGITITNAAGGLATVTLAPSDTRNLTDQWQSLVWDLQLVDGSNVYTVANGALQVTPDVTVSTS
jgi:hypothetical protein